MQNTDVTYGVEMALGFTNMHSPHSSKYKADVEMLRLWRPEGSISKSERNFRPWGNAPALEEDRLLRNDT